MFCILLLFFPVFTGFPGHLSMSVHVSVRTLSGARIRYQFESNQIKKGFFFALSTAETRDSSVPHVQLDPSTLKIASKNSLSLSLPTPTLVSAFLCSGFLPRQAPASQQHPWTKRISFPILSAKTLERTSISPAYVSGSQVEERGIISSNHTTLTESEQHLVLHRKIRHYHEKKEERAGATINACCGRCTPVSP